MFQYEKIPKPKRLREVPGYLKKIICGFFSRLLYVFKLVHETGKWIFAALTAVTVLRGIIPVILTYVSKYLLNTLQTMHGKGSGLEEFTHLSFSTENILFLIIAMSFLGILNTVIHQISDAITKIAGERVTMQVRVRIMEKARRRTLPPSISPHFTKSLKMPTAKRDTDPST